MKIAIILILFIYLCMILKDGRVFKFSRMINKIGHIIYILHLNVISNESGSLFSTEI